MNNPTQMDVINNQISIKIKKLDYPQSLLKRQMILSMSKDVVALAKMNEELDKAIKIKKANK